MSDEEREAHELHDQVRRLQTEVERLKADKERLDCVLAQIVIGECTIGDVIGTREAIDEARK